MGQLTAGELCAGYGGLALAVEEVFQAKTAWFSEYDDAPSRILAERWPGVPNLGDMTKIDWSAVQLVDILSGGTPCQGQSGAGARAGMTEGTRSNLWVQMREAIATIQPRYVVWENVRGAFSAKADSCLESCPGCVGEPGNGEPVLRALGRVLGDLSDLGYDCQWRGLRAADVGAAHGRFRVFILATRRGTADLPNADLTAGPERRVTTPAQAPGGRAWSHPGRRSGVPVAHTNHAGRGEQRGALAVQAPHPTAEHQGADAGTSWGEYGPAVRRWESVVGRCAPAPTELSRTGHRRLSARFAEWMMGVPDGWIVDVPGISRNQALKAAGNGVVPQQAAAALYDMLTMEGRP